jgi:hypothetical protein
LLVLLWRLCVGVVAGGGGGRGVQNLHPSYCTSWHMTVGHFGGSFSRCFRQVLPVPAQAGTFIYYYFTPIPHSSCPADSPPLHTSSPPKPNSHPTRLLPIHRPHSITGMFRTPDARRPVPAGVLIAGNFFLLGFIRILRLLARNEPESLNSYSGKQKCIYSAYLTKRDSLTRSALNIVSADVGTV